MPSLSLSSFLSLLLATTATLVSGQQQSQQINTYQQQEKQFFEERDFYQKKIAELEQSLQEIRDQYTSLKLSSKQSK